MHGITLVDFSSALDHFTKEGSLGDFSARLYPKKRFIMKRQRHENFRTRQHQLSRQRGVMYILQTDSSIFCTYSRQPHSTSHCFQYLIT